MCRTKGFIVVAVLLALVLMLSSISLACGAKPAQTPTSPPPISTEPQTVPSTSSQLPEETSPLLLGQPDEPEIPANYTTYTDESNIFSISYPADWELALSLIPELERKAKESISKLKLGHVEDASIIFYAGLRTTTGGHNPGVNIVVGPVPAGVSTFDQWVEAEINGLKKSIQSYREYSRKKTTIDGREATLVEYQSTSQGQGGPVTSYCLQMYTRIDKTGWVVSCGTSLIDDAAKWGDDFNAIVRSLRVSN